MKRTYGFKQGGPSWAETKELSIYSSLTNKSTFYLTWESLNLHENTHNYRCYVFRSSTILRERVQSLAKVTLL